MWGHGGDKNMTTKGNWGVGAWGGKSREPCGPGESMGVPRLRAGESLGDLIQRERLLARRIAKAEVHAEEAARSGAAGVGKLRF
jgi:magnesium transporter